MILLLITSFYFDTGIKGDLIFPYGLNISITPVYEIGIEGNVFLYRDNDNEQNLFWEVRFKKSFLNNTRFAPYIGIGYGKRTYTEIDNNTSAYHFIVGLHTLAVKTSQEIPSRGLYLEPEITIGEYKDYKGFSIGFGIGYRW